MKKLNLVTSTDDLRPHLKFIQVKNGKVYATNCHVLVRIEVKDVFGPNVIEEDEELYFSGEQWKKQNFSKAVLITREGLIFKALDKKYNLIGMIEAKTAENIGGKFPDCEQVIPTYELSAVEKICFSHSLYFDLIECFNDQSANFIMEFRGKNKGIIVKDNINKESTNIGLIMPKYVSTWDY